MKFYAETMFGNIILSRESGTAAGKRRLFLRRAGHLSDDKADRECRNVYSNDGRAHRRPGEDGDNDPRGRADHRDDRGTDRHAFEASEQPHRGKRGEDHQSGYQQRPDQVHRQYDDNSGNDGDQQVVAVYRCPGRFRERFIKGHSEDLVVKKDKDQHHQSGKDRAQDHFPFVQRQDRCRTEKCTAHITGEVR